ncbi:MAG: oligosaccharide flippase family protein [Bacteroidetes bacterium]|nr:oligosaccharide flippase family protein [Bacteroidota bacterium]
MLTLVSASILAQVVNFSFNIVLTRIYTPEQFGYLSVFMAIVSFITVFSAAKFDVALVASNNDEDAKKLFSLSFWVLIFTSVIALLGVIVVKIFHLYNTPVVSDWLFYLIPSIIFLTGFQICWMWNVRIKNFKNISGIRVIEPIVNGTVSLLLVGFSSIGLLFGTLAGQFISFVLLLIIVFKKFPLKQFAFSFQELKQTFKTYNEFPKINVTQGFVEIFQMSAFALLLDYFFDAAIVGYFAMGMRVLQVPVRLLVTPVAHVFFAEASEIYRNGNSLLPLVKKTIFRLALIASPVPVILMFFGEELFAFVFGNNWSISGEYAKILAFWTFFDLIRAPISQIASIVNKQRHVLIFSVFSSIVFLIAFCVGGWYFQNINITLWLISITQSILSILLILLLINISKQKN